MSMEIHYTVADNNSNTVTMRQVRTQAHTASVSVFADARTNCYDDR